MDSDQLVVELIIGCGVRQEGVTICDEKIQDLYHLHSNDIMIWGD